MKDENPLDLEQREEETAWDVWKRRLMFVLLIILCVTFAAPTFGGCEGSFTGGEKIASFRIGDETSSITDEKLRETHHRLTRVYRVMYPGAKVEEDDVIRHLLLDAVARHEGVKVTDDEVMRQIRALPSFQRVGAFDRDTYERALVTAGGGLTDADVLTSMRELVRVRAIQGLYLSSMATASSREAYEAWAESNEKLDLAAAVLEFEPLREKIDALSPGDAELQEFARIPTVEAKLRLPPRKTLEVAVLLAADMTDQQLAAAETALRDAGVVVADDGDTAGGAKTMRGLAMEEFASHRTAVYTEANWKARARADYRKVLTAAEAAWKAAGNEGPLPDDHESRPENEADAPWPTSLPEQYAQKWEAGLRREVAAREIARLIASAARTQNKPLAEVAKEYDATGVRIVSNAEPLSDDDLATEFPEGLAEGSELPNVVRVYLKGPAPGESFLPQVHAEPVPTTNRASRLERRGYMAVRLAGWDPARMPTLDEARDEIAAAWREHKVEETAKSTLEKLRDDVAGGSDFESAAQSAGALFVSLEGVNQATESLSPPVADPGEELSPQEKAVAQRITHRNRLLQDYGTLRMTAAGEFRSASNVLLDKTRGAAYLVRVTGKRKPLPIEMSNSELERAKVARSQESYERVGELLSLESLKSRYRFEDHREKPDEDGGAETGDSDG